jgi:hypothetical protein
MIHLASVVNDVDYFSIGRNLKNLGLADMKLDEIETYLQTGKKPKPRRASSKPRCAVRAKG